jgi:hypothetical protein
VGDARAGEPEQAEWLAGNVGGAWRIGGTVHRPIGRWTPAVHALLPVQVVDAVPGRIQLMLDWIPAGAAAGDAGLRRLMTQGEPERSQAALNDVGRSDRGDMPVLPAQSEEDTDVGWGEQPEPEDDERLHRERPPHWDSL